MTPTFLSDQFDAMYYVPSYRSLVFSAGFAAGIRISSSCFFNICNFGGTLAAGS